MNSNRLKDYFTPHRRFSNKPPRFYLDSGYDLDDPYEMKVYFVNNSDHPLEWVELRNPLLYNKSMSEAEQLASEVQYLSVQQSEAVLVAEFEIIFDSDFLHELNIAWKVTGEPEKDARVTGKVSASSSTLYLSGFLMPPERDFTATHENFNSEWYIHEFRFDRSRKNASISNPDTGMRMELPRQDRIVDGFPLHEYCEFSPELSSYLRYLKTHHLVLFSESLEIVLVTDSDELEVSDTKWNDEGSISYDTLIFRMPTASALPCFGFSFIDDTLYSSIYLEICEYG